jgi:hypothetical protein
VTVPNESYGVEAELERLLACPECGSRKVKVVRESVGGYGFFGFKAITDAGAPRLVHCSNCGHEWMRPPIKELRREAERRIDERYDQVDVENQRLRRQLENYLAYQRDVDRQLVAPVELPDANQSGDRDDARAAAESAQPTGQPAN